MKPVLFKNLFVVIGLWAAGATIGRFQIHLCDHQRPLPNCPEPKQQVRQIETNATTESAPQTDIILTNSILRF